MAPISLNSWLVDSTCQKVIVQERRVFILVFLPAVAIFSCSTIPHGAIDELQPPARCRVQELWKWRLPFCTKMPHSLGNFRQRTGISGCQTNTEKWLLATAVPSSWNRSKSIIVIFQTKFSKTIAPLTGMPFSLDRLSRSCCYRIWDHSFLYTTACVWHRTSVCDEMYWNCTLICIAIIL